MLLWTKRAIRPWVGDRGRARIDRLRERADFLTLEEDRRVWRDRQGLTSGTLDDCGGPWDWGIADAVVSEIGGAEAGADARAVKKLDTRRWRGGRSGSIGAAGGIGARRSVAVFDRVGMEPGRRWRL